jgi:hypothetical protein
MSISIPAASLWRSRVHELWRPVPSSARSNDRDISPPRALEADWLPRHLLQGELPAPHALVVPSRIGARPSLLRASGQDGGGAQDRSLTPAPPSRATLKSS